MRVLQYFNGPDLGGVRQQPAASPPLTARSSLHFIDVVLPCCHSDPCSCRCSDDVAAFSCAGPPPPGSMGQAALCQHHPAAGDLGTWGQPCTAPQPPQLLVKHTALQLRRLGHPALLSPSLLLSEDDSDAPMPRARRVSQQSCRASCHCYGVPTKI